MRIALVHPYAWPEVRRGAERYLEDLTTYLRGQGHDVWTITGTHGTPERRALGTGTDVRVTLPRPRWRLHLSEVETFAMAVLPALARARAEVVHALVPAAALAGRLLGRPTLYTVLGHPDPAQLPPQALPRRLFLQAARRASAVAALSAASARALDALAGRTAVVLSPGVRLERFPAELAPRSGPPVVLVSASLDDPRKRVDLALEAFDLLRRRRPGARLVLSGQGDPRRLLERADPDLRAAVEIAGPGRPDEVPGRYRRASVTLLPAAHEAFGMALVESLASGTPVVCTPDGGMPEIVDPAVGCVAASASASALCAALDAALTLAADPATPARCVTRARRWDWDDAVGPAHVEVYRALRERRPATAALS